MESIINHELCNINTWLCSNKLLLNIEKTNFVTSKPHQNKLNYSMKLPLMVNQYRTLEMLNI